MTEIERVAEGDGTRIWRVLQCTALVQLGSELVEDQDPVLKCGVPPVPYKIEPLNTEH